MATKLIAPNDGVRPDAGNKSGLSGTYSSGNPYVGIDPTDSLSFWNRITDALGITNHAGSAWNQQEQNAALWESEYSLAMEDREYNSEQAVADRMRAAGQNPDLLGVDAGQSSLSGNSAAALGSGHLAGQNTFSQALSTIGSALQSAISIYTGIAGLQNTILDQDMTRFTALSEGTKDDFASYLVGKLKPEDYKSVLNNSKGLIDILTSGDSPYDKAEQRYSLINDFVSRNTDFLRSKRAKNYASRYLMSYIGSSDFQRNAMEKIRSLSDTRVSAAEASAKEAALRGLSGQDDVSEVLTEIAQYAYQLDKQMKSNDYRYATQYSPESAANAVNAQNDSVTQSRTKDYQLGSVMSSFIDVLYKNSKEGNKFASILLTTMVIGNNLKGAALQAIPQMIK